MLLMNGSILHSDVLHFPEQYAVALPRKAVDGARVPLALVLHDLGAGREDVLHNVRLERLVEETQTALVLPEGRRSCFLDMAHGPRWSAFLKDELLPVLHAQMGLDTSDPLAAGIGAGALGALRLAADGGMRAALIDPVLEDAFGWNKARWPKQAEWLSVFEDRQEEWKPEALRAARGLLVGSAETLDGCMPRLSGDWARATQDGDLESKLLTALSYDFARVSH